MATNDSTLAKCMPFLKALFQAFTKNSAPGGGPASSSYNVGSLAKAFGSVVVGDDEKWKQTNIGGIGSDRDKQLRQEAAASEKEFAGAGQALGLELWRVEQFKPRRLPRDEWGKFHTGDSYIVMNTYQLPNKNRYEHDIHFWLGSDSTQDEKGAAAYFTVNLDDLLGTLPVQHREVQGSESDLFKSYFNGRLEYLAGGVPSGFQEGGVPFTATPGSTGSRSIPVPPELSADPEKKLIRVSDESGKMTVTTVETARKLSRDKLSSDDVFVAAAASSGAFVYFGNNCSSQERLFVTDAIGVVLGEAGLPETTRVTFVNEGSETPAFEAMMS